MARDWDESEHPRHPRGSEEGGRFRLAAPMLHNIIATTMPGWVRKVSQRLAGGYVPREWEWIGTGQYRRELFAELSRDIPADVVDEIFADYEWPAVVLRNGDHSVTFHSREIALQHGSAVLEHLDELQTRFPVGQKIRFAVVPEANLQGDRGSSLPGAGIFYISEETFDDWDRSHPNDYVMPVGRRGRRRVEQWRYAMTHEWGHLIDPAAISMNVEGVNAGHPLQDRAAQMWRDYLKHLSGYGRKDKRGLEATAEAFAEWFLSRGQTKNLAAIAYALLLGWGWSR